MHADLDMSFQRFISTPFKATAIIYQSMCVASLVAQLVKNPPAIQETPVRFLGWKDPLEKG